jgi:hypothetical protein
MFIARAPPVCAVRRSGTPVDRYSSRHHPLLRTARVWDTAPSYKHFTPIGVPKTRFVLTATLANTAQMGFWAVVPPAGNRLL